MKMTFLTTGMSRKGRHIDALLRALFAALLFCLAGSALAQQRVDAPQASTGGQAAGNPAAVAYLKPGTAAVGGVRHLVLIYAGAKNRVAWDAEKLLPYVAYVDRQGKPQDWLFDSFLWIEFATPDGVWLHHPMKDKRAIRHADWQWLLEAFFDPAHGVGQLDTSVRLAANSLFQVVEFEVYP